eukprot:PhF_6_TR10213/c0_g1_i1/m.15833
MNVFLAFCLVAYLTLSPITMVQADIFDVLFQAFVPVIQKRNGSNWVPIEVDMCHTDPHYTIPCIMQPVVTSIDGFTYFRVVFFMVNKTQPYIQVERNATSSMVITDVFAPYLDDDPWELPQHNGRSQIDIAWKTTRQLTNLTTGLWALNFRFPATPCVTESVYIFNFLDAKGKWRMWYYGATSGKVCNTSSTTGSNEPGCSNPIWLPHCLN